LVVEYIAYWLPKLWSLAKEMMNIPGASYIKWIAPLKFDSRNQKKRSVVQQVDMAKNVYRR
jgi:hypothetical protein